MRLSLPIGVLTCFLAAASGTAMAGHLEAEKALKTGQYARALTEYGRMAEQGDPKAQAKLGQMYAQGLGVNVNQQKALEWMRKSAEQDEPEGAFGLARAYYNGEALPQDKVTAAKWFREAAEKGHGSAAYRLALMLMKGDGIPKDIESGHLFMNQARRAKEMDAVLYQRNQLDAAGEKMKVRFAGGFGDSQDSAVRIEGPASKQDGVPAQRKFVELLYPGWHNYKQSLLPVGSKYFDAFELTGPGNEHQTVYFDVSHWYKN
jgi:TPR repeat protein